MNKLSKEKKQQLIMVAVGTLGAMVAIYFLLISTQLAEVSKKTKETEETRQKVEKAENTVKKSEEAEKEMKARAKQLGLIEERMAAGDLTVWMINTLKPVSDQNEHVKILNTSTEPVSVPVGILPVFPYNAIRYEVRGNGYYHDLGKFFTEFENSQPYFRIQNLELEPGDASLSEDHEKLTFKADFVVLLKPEPVATPSPKPK